MLRVGAVNYLNTKPLIEGLAGSAPGLELSLDLPSRLADRLAAAELDVALIPVVEYFRGDHYSFVPDVSISSRGPVLSVTLFSRVPWPEIRSIALDEGSRTSAALTKILCGQKYNIVPQYEALPMSVPADDVSADAALLIGDRAMKACLPGFEYAYDLGEEWTDWTGLPMVFAVWAVRPGVDLGAAAGAFAAAKRRGLARAGELAAREAAALGLDAGYCRRYFTNIIRYDLGAAERAGLTEYYRRAAQAGLVPQGVPLVEYARPRLAACR
jgi:chorismate dehydratase